MGFMNNSRTGIAAATIAAALAFTGAAEAKTYKIKTTAPSGKGSLRKAIKQANKNDGRDKIKFKKSLQGEIAVREKTRVKEALRIVGNDNGKLTLVGLTRGSEIRFKVKDKKASRIFGLELDRVTITYKGQFPRRGGLQVFQTTLDGENTTRGPGIEVDGGRVKLFESSVRRFNRSGVVSENGSAEVVGSTIAGNDSIGLYVRGGEASVDSSTISENRSMGVSAVNGAISLVNSTLSSNGDPTEPFAGAAYTSRDGVITFESSTVTGTEFRPQDDEAEFPFFTDEEGALQGYGTITLESTIVANSGGPNCADRVSFVSNGGNVIDDTTACDTLEPSDQEADPLLGPLADNGGETMTHSIGALSPAIGAATSGGPELDQRGIERDSDPDSGAFERAGGDA